MTFKLGLTGSIGMGKSTSAALFADQGCAVWDADAAVHRLYSKNGAAVAKFLELLPDAIVDEAVSRDRLKHMISRDPAVLKIVEQIVHPLVRDDRETFSLGTKAEIAVFDIPLLFETGSEAEFDAVACAYIDEEEQVRRVMARQTMSLEQFEMIKSKQMPIAQKLDQSDYHIKTDSIESATQQVRAIIAEITDMLAHA